MSPVAFLQLPIVWSDLWVELVLQTVAFFASLLLGYFLLIRKRLRDLHRLQVGDSDEVIFQMHWLYPHDDGRCVLLFRNVAPTTTVNRLFDNEAARRLVRKLADQTAIDHPILQTQGRDGFELLNTAIGYLSGHLAISPLQRETWLMAMTCEDRQVVRKKCIRVFLIRPDDLQRFCNWKWCCDKVLIEQPSHWFRVMALHWIARYWQQEQSRLAARSPEPQLVDEQHDHPRLRPLSLGLSHDERPVSGPFVIPWDRYTAELDRRGLPFPGANDGPPAP